MLKQRYRLGGLLAFIELIVLIAVGIPAACATAQWTSAAAAVHKSANDPRDYQAIKLANGMTVLLVSDKDASKSLAALALPVGSLDDPNGQLGLAHYTEHMLLMGSKKYPQPESLDEFLKKHGGSHNGSTAPYRTAFYLEVENDALPQAVDRLADAIAEPLLDPVNADRERNAVNAELTMARSREGMRMAQVRAETFNPAHPAARFSGGNLDTLKDKPGNKLQDALQGFYQRYYSANLMVGVIYSNRPIQELAHIAAETFGKIGNHNASVPAISEPLVTPTQQGIIIHYVPATPRKQLLIEFAIDNNSAQFRSKTDTYISYLIGNRSKDTLSDWLQKQGLADGINAGADPMSLRNQGLFSISVSLTDKGVAEKDRVIAAIFNYLTLISQQGVKKPYFDELSHVMALNFRFPDITRDMDYVEWLVDNMLRVPVQNVLDSPYVADDFAPQEIENRLAQLTPQNARFWFVSPEEPHNKVAYFMNAPYQVDNIPAAEFEKWQQLEQHITLSLPELNPYIPQHLNIVNGSDEQRSELKRPPQLIVDQKGLRVFYRPSYYFSSSPKADITVAFRNANAFTSAKNQVLYGLNDYLTGVVFDELSYQASIGGIDFSSSSDNGLTFNASGFSERLPDLLCKLVEQYSNVSITEKQLSQAKSWYLERLRAADKGKAYELALQPVQLLSRWPYTERSEREKLLASITLDDVLNYRKQLIQQGAVEILVVGNMTAPQVAQMSEELVKKVSSHGVSWWRGEDINVQQPRKVNLQRIGSSTDSALAAVYVPAGYSEMQSIAYSSLLGQIIQPWFYSQLRTQEQLGYAVFAFPIAIGKQWGIGFLLQSSNKQPDYLYQRYLAFYPQAEKRLRAMSADEFNQYKQGLINELKQQPQTLGEEAGRLGKDFSRGNAQFDTRHQTIAAISSISQQQLADYFQHTVINMQGLALLSQVSGNDSADPHYAAPKGWTTYPNTSSLQQSFSHQVNQ